MAPSLKRNRLALFSQRRKLNDGGWSVKKWHYIRRMRNDCKYRNLMTRERNYQLLEQAWLLAKFHITKHYYMKVEFTFKIQ